MKNLLCLLALLLCTTVFAQPQQVVVGVSGNGYVTRQQDGARITQRGVTHWTNPKSIVSIYFYLHQPTTADLSLYAKGHSEIKVSYGKKGSHTIIDMVTVHLDIKKDCFFAEFSNLGLSNVPITDDYPEKYDRLLCGGIWCIVQLEYESEGDSSFGMEDLDSEPRQKKQKDVSPISIRKLTPIQMPHIAIGVHGGAQRSQTLRNCIHAHDKSLLSCTCRKNVRRRFSLAPIVSFRRTDCNCPGRFTPAG